MALGDRMASRFSQSSASVSSHLDEYSHRQEGDDVGQRRESEASAGANPAMAATGMAYLPQTVFLCESRHEGFEECAATGPSESGLVSKWRPKDRMKTGCVALVVCLNIGVDPPDVIKISPCARMECWIDPFSMTPPKALDTIGNSLHAQYERWQPRARYRLQLDPTVEEVKKLCSSCRKNARSERVLFHYNGHGVPKPTANGEIWVFNKSYTQYIPLPISELDSWLKTPSIYVFDCSAAGIIVNALIERQEWNSSGASSASGSSKDCILLAACEAHETLPQSAEFPADVFTSCLTTPIKMALHWLVCHLLQSRSIYVHMYKALFGGAAADQGEIPDPQPWICSRLAERKRAEVFSASAESAEKRSSSNRGYASTVADHVSKRRSSNPPLLQPPRQTEPKSI